MFAKVLRRLKFVVLPNGAGMMLRAWVGYWLTRSAANAGRPPRFRECYTFDLDPNIPRAEQFSAVRVRFRELIANRIAGLDALAAEDLLKLPRDLIDHSLDPLETDDDNTGLLSELASLVSEEIET
jgi:hypothetical protein